MTELVLYHDCVCVFHCFIIIAHCSNGVKQENRSQEVRSHVRCPKDEYHGKHVTNTTFQVIKSWRNRQDTSDIETVFII